MRRTRLKIIGIDCPSCVYAIERRLRSLGCVSSFKVEVSTGEAEVEYDDEKCLLKNVYEAVRDAGYDVYKEKMYFDLKSLSGEEAALLESKIRGLQGVFDAKISLTGVATVVYNPLETTPEDVASRLVAYGAKPLTAVAEKSVSLGEKTLLYRRVASFIIGLTAVSLSMYSMLNGGVQGWGAVSEKLLLPMAAAAIVLNYDIVARGLKSLLMLIPVMDSLIAVSVISTFTAGVASTIGLMHLHGGLHSSSFFEASAGVIGFVGLGKYLEERLRRRAFKSLEELASLLRGSVRVVVGDSVVEKPVSQLAPGEVVEVRAGEIIPVDGVVVEGSGYVDESSFTGEPVPRAKKAENRDPVLAGSVLNTGFLRVRATRVGGDLLIAQVIETVREAESVKPRLARLADKIVGYFTWIVLGLAAATFSYWSLLAGNLQMGVVFTAAVLTVACPCALGIATPLVVSIAVLKASRSGVLIRAGDVFEKILGSNTIVFDKTGTLTVGKPAVVKTHLLGNAGVESVLRMACSVESRSEHPLSRAIVEKCVSEKVEFPEPEEYVSIPGEGVYGLVEGIGVAVGNLELAERLGVPVSEKALRLVEEAGARGNTPVMVFINNEVEAVLEIGDVVKDEAASVVRALKERGFRVGLASGDVEASVKYYREALGLDFAYWGLKPRDKADLVRDMQRNGLKVVFVGDGLNDAPALAVADVGVAMGSGADVSKEAGDIVVLNNSLRTLTFLLDFSRLVKRKIVQNIAWAFAYNVVLIPLAMGVLYLSHRLFITPEMAAAAMILSDVSVLANALSVLRS
ncbi:cadmium-translocating P-type ATPase [Thermosphaera chiliense]|uniref:Cadmium-translocating P-type ATPase n=1 Tax=Thermosphaera chiliense TaxID=3402707 RepID=A0A7M1USY7_9CREN|nr:cation-translocating P-type ATPase [Thermosphaera aggregans]QOR94613.1 cadmium-translocating P-type ATPase [Thermosphaera aggregans]